MNKCCQLAFSMIVLLLLISCEKEVSLEGEPVNTYGGFSRNNSYERFGDFYRQIYFVDSYDSVFAGGTIAPLLAISGYKIVFPSSDGEIIFFDNREMMWHAKLDSENVASAGMCADPKQNIYVIDNAGLLYSYSVKGKLRWKKYFNKITDKDIVTFSDLLAVNDGIVAASSNGKISKFNFDGKIVWEKKYNSAILKYFPADDHHCPSVFLG